MLEYEKIFKHGTVSSNVYSFMQLSGITSSGLVDFSTRLTWCVTDLSPRTSTSSQHDVYKARSDRGVYGCDGLPSVCNAPKTFTPTLLYHEDRRRHLKSWSNKLSPTYENLSASDGTSELRQRLLLNVKYYQGVDLYQRTPDVHKLTSSAPSTPTSAVSNSSITDTDLESDTCSSLDRKTKKYKCQYCNVTCTNNGQLKGHLRVHTGEKPYTCNFLNCGRAFARNEELTRHRRIHSGVRPHQCPTCSKYFGRKDHLNKHIKTHLKTCDKKNYVCPIQKCEQRYTRSDALARHQWSSHGIKPKSSKWKSESSL